MKRLVVVGAGRVGSAFIRAADAVHVPVTVVRRGEPATALATPDPGVPILVATRADALDGIVRATCPENRADLVFIQNGMILPLLRAHGVEGCTQGLVYFAATSREGPVEPGAPSLFWGPHAAAMVTLLTHANIPARVLADRAELGREIAIKLAWNVIFGLLGDTYGETVGDTAAQRPDEVAALAAELAPVLARAVETDVPVSDLVARLLAYSAAIPGFRAGVRELPWRSGWVATASAAYGIPTPRHGALLAALGHTSPA